MDGSNNKRNNLKKREVWNKRIREDAIGIERRVIKYHSTTFPTFLSITDTR